MNTDSVILRLQKLLETKSVFSICLPSNPTLDGVAAATALYLGLSKLGKTVSIASDAQIDGHFDLVAADKIQNALSSQGDNLVVSFPYQEGAIDKVTYNIEGNLFNLVIQPKDGFEKLDPSQVQFRNTGGKVDVLFVLDSPTLETLGQLYIDNQDSFKGVDIVNIDRHLTNTNFGTVNIVEKQSSSLSEVVSRLLQEVGVEVDVDIATNLFSGIVAATNNFTAYSVNAGTFEASALLLKKGAVKKPARVARPATDYSQQQPSFNTQPQVTAPQQSYQTPSQSRSQVQQPRPQPQQSHSPMRSQNQIQSQTQPHLQQSSQTPREDIINDESERFDIEAVENKEASRPQKPPKDWLRPKIFKGGSGGLV